jgi:hypothetical protein
MTKIRLIWAVLRGHTIAHNLHIVGGGIVLGHDERYIIAGCVFEAGTSGAAITILPKETL